MQTYKATREDLYKLFLVYQEYLEVILNNPHKPETKPVDYRTGIIIGQQDCAEKFAELLEEWSEKLQKEMIKLNENALLNTEQITAMLNAIVAFTEHSDEIKESSEHTFEDGYRAGQIITKYKIYTELLNHLTETKGTK